MYDYDMSEIRIINAGNMYTKDEINAMFIKADLSFKFTVETTTASQVFTIPCQNVGVFDAIVSWGDGTTSPITTYNSANLAHTYVTAGTYNISISGNFPNIYFNNTGSKYLIKSVEQLGNIGWLSLNSAFSGCSNMTSFTAGLTDTSNVTSMGWMFNACSALTSLDVSNFNTTKVTSVTFMFSNCSALTSLDVSNFNTSNVIDMGYMFNACLKLTSLDVSNFNTSNVTAMTYMFGSCPLLTSLTGVEAFNIAKVTSIGSFITSGKITTAQYDALLVNWDNQVVKPTLTIPFGSSKYTAGSAAATARAHLISSDLWTITDGGTA